MTTKEKFLQMLTDRGLWPDEAEAVLERGRSSIEQGGYRMTWNRPASEYPDALYAVGLMVLKPHAIAWIDENKPMHFAREMFVAGKS